MVLPGRGNGAACELGQNELPARGSTVVQQTFSGVCSLPESLFETRHRFGIRRNEARRKCIHRRVDFLDCWMQLGIKPVSARPSGVPPPRAHRELAECGKADFLLYDRADYERA